MASTLITAPDARSLIRNPIYVTLESDEFTGSAPAYVPAQDNLSCRLEVWRSLTGTFDTEERLAAPLKGPYSTIDKRITFDISRLIPRAFPPAIPTAQSIGVSPGSSDPYYGEAEGLVQLIRLKYADQYGDPVAAETLTVSDGYLTIDGGLPADALQDINWAGALIGLHSYYWKRHSAFTFVKPVGVSQPDWIYYVALVSDDIEVTVTIQYTDGTYDSYVSHTMAVVANTAYWTQAGYAQLKIDAHADTDKVVRGYNVSLVRVTGAQNAFTAFYVIDDVCPTWERYMLYHNGFGGYESVRLKGITRYAHQVTRDQFERTRWTDFTTEQGTMDDLRVYGSPVFNTHTGHYPAYYVEHLRQLLHARLWMIEVDAYEAKRFRRVICETDQVDLRTDVPGADGFAITYRPSYDDDGFNIF